MEEQYVAVIGTLLNETEENVKSFAEEGTLGDKVSALGLMNKSQVETLKENYAKEVRQSHLGELTESAKQGNLPQDLYKPIHGAVLEKTEKALSRKYEVVDYDGFDDLVDKAISKHKGQSDDKQLQELEKTLNDLKEANKSLVKDKEETEQRIKGEFEAQMMQRDMGDHVSRVQFDLSDIEADKTDEVLKSRKEILNSVFSSRYDTAYIDGRIVVKGKDGEAVKNPATLEPVPVGDVLLMVAKDVGMKLKSPESGGQGGSSSGKSGKLFNNYQEFVSYCQKEGINPTMRDGVKLWKESGLKS